jgi:hypothetical protein
MLSGFLALANNNSTPKKPLKMNQADAKIAAKPKRLHAIASFVASVKPRNPLELQVEISAMLSRKESAPVVKPADLPTSWHLQRRSLKDKFVILTPRCSEMKKCLMVVS